MSEYIGDADMKIIRTSNYNNESEAEYIVADNIKHMSHADVMCCALQDDRRRSDYDWFRVVEDDHRLWRGMEELV